MKNKNRKNIKKHLIAASIMAIIMQAGYGLSAVSAAPADTVRQAGQIIGQSVPIMQERTEYIQREEKAKLDEQKRQDALLPIQEEKEISTDNQTTFLLKGFKYDSSEILSPEEVSAIMAEYENKQVSMQDLQNMISKINKLYRAKNYITAKAILPPQKIKNGEVEIKFIEGRYGAFKVQNNKSIKEKYYVNRLGLDKGQLVHLEDLEKSLVYFNRTNPVQIKGELVPGTEVGETDLLQIGRAHV